MRLIFIVCFITLFVEDGDISLRVEQPKHATPPFRVWVMVNAPGDLASEIRGYIHQELQRLPDVEIVEDYPWRYELHIVATQSGTKLGDVSFAIAALRIFDNSEFAEDLVREVTDGLYENIHLAVVSSQKRNLRKMCKEVIARFDIHVLERERPR